MSRLPADKEILVPGCDRGLSMPALLIVAKKRNGESSARRWAAIVREVTRYIRKLFWRFARTDLVNGEGS
jgi:hypothetical protein